MEKGVIPTVAGATLIVLLAILTFVFRSSDYSELSWIIFIGVLIGGGLLIYSLLITEVKWVKIMARVFFIIPILTAIVFIFIMGIMAYRTPITIADKEAFFYSFAVGSLVTLGYGLEIVLFVMVSRKSHVVLKVLTGMVGAAIYFVTGVIGAAIITPPSFGTYGTPLYKPKKK